ncbi:DUF4160 domain-containing protein [Spirosoma areae]
MPKIAVYEFLTFFAVMFDITGNEPPHLHVYKTKKASRQYAKIWLETAQFAETGPLTLKEQKLVIKLIESNRSKLLDAYRKVGTEKITPLKLKL